MEEKQSSYHKRLPQRETRQAAAAYATYAALGPDRSLSKLAEHQWQSKGAKGERERAIRSIRTQLGLWSSQHRWQERVKEYDRQQIEKKRRQRDAELEKLNEEQAKYGKGMSALAMKQIQTLIEAKSFNAQSAVLLFKYSTDLEREARGAAARIELEVGGKSDADPIRTEHSQTITIYLPRKDELFPVRQIEEKTGDE